MKGVREKGWWNELGAMWGLELVYVTHGGGGVLSAGLVHTVDSLKCIQHAHVSPNLVGLSFA